MMRVQQGDRVLFDGPVVLGQDTPPGENPLAQPSVGVIKLATLRPQQAIVLELYPDAEAYFRTLQTGVPQPMTQANAPFIRYQEWTGKLLDTSLSGLDTRFMHVSGSGVLGEGNSVDLDRGCVVAKPNQTPPSSAADVVCSPPPGDTALLMSFPELRQYSRLQISHDTTVPYVLAAAILIVLGLLPALYVSRRKVWVRARPDGPGSIVQVGGFSLQRKDRFDEEFASLVEAVVTAAGGAPTAEPAEVLRP
jgi:cytochrome c biogenesis protein ResB